MRNKTLPKTRQSELSERQLDLREYLRELPAPRPLMCVARENGYERWWSDGAGHCLQDLITLARAGAAAYRMNGRYMLWSA